MCEEDAVSEKIEPVANGKVEGKTGAVQDKIGKQPDDLTEMEEDKQDEGKSEPQQMDDDKEKANGEKAEGAKAAQEEGIEKTKKEEETEADVEKKETVKEDGGKEEVMDEKIEELTEAKEDTMKETDEKVEEDDKSKDEEDKPEEPKGSKKRPRSKTGHGKRRGTKKKEPAEVEKEQIVTPTQEKTKEPKPSVQKKEHEPKTPTAFAMERPVRKRKSVERLVATIEKDSSKGFRIEKGRGTALKDIPNVAYKLSRKKNEETFKMLHGILFGRRGKVSQVKINISKFSGFVWSDNEEKQTSRLKEKLDKCVKEKLIEFCDVLDVPISKASAKKEDIVAKLMEFFMEPHATTSDMLAEKIQGTKRKRASSTPSKGSVKSRKKGESDSKKRGEAMSSPPESEDESEEDKGEDRNGAPEGSDEMSDQAASGEKGSESEEESDKDRGKQKSSKKKGSSEKSNTKKVAISKKSIPPPKKLSAKSPDRSKSNNDSSAKKSSVKKDESGKKKVEAVKKKDEAMTKKDEAAKKRDEAAMKKAEAAQKDEAMTKSSTPKKSPVNESPGRKVLKVKQKPKEETPKPSDDELRNSICKILKEVDFNTATFTDILKLLGKEFSADLAPRKATVKEMIQEELAKLADADEEDEEDENAPPSSVGVKA